jgi:hypothetical protein
MADLKPAFKYVIVPKGEPYWLAEELKVVSLSDFLQQELSFIF